ncbi:MAG: hypothetical protein K2J35_03055, partial [Eubacterium sp.]|nr:hypothetical protein [Eubacterium sp.]
NISIECDDEIIERIKENTFSKLELSNNKKKLFIKNIKQTDLKRLIAISIAFVIVCGGISVVAVVGFMPDDTLSEYFNANDFINYIGTGG